MRRGQSRTRGSDPKLEIAPFTVGIRLESIGFMVFERLVNLDTVDELMGGFALIYWSLAEPWVKRRRQESADPKAFEWCEWLTMRIAERRSKARSQPAYLREDWEGPLNRDRISSIFLPSGSRDDRRVGCVRN
jgi:hypothetical protein